MFIILFEFFPNLPKMFKQENEFKGFFAFIVRKLGKIFARN